MKLLIAPDIPVKGCFNWCVVKEYVDQHPNEFLMISCAAGSLASDNCAAMQNSAEYAALKDLLKNDNVIVVCSGGNPAPASWKMYNERRPDGNRFQASSPNTEDNKYNKITAKGHFINPDKNYFSPNFQIYGGLKGSLNVGYEIEHGNILMPTIPLINSVYNVDGGTNCSYPTAVLSAMIGNAVSIIMSNHPGITPADAMAIIAGKYLTGEKLRYIDETTDGKIVEAEDSWYILKMQDILNNELLHLEELESQPFESDSVELPAGKGTCYLGKGVQFEYNGNKYDVTDAATLQEALKSDGIKWYWNKDRFRKYGGTTTATLDVYVVDKAGQTIPDCHLTLTKNVQ